MNQSESRTWPAVVAEAKTVTRRHWKPSTRAWYRKGRIFDAYDKATFQGGVRIARCQVTQDAYEEAIGDMPDEDWVGEGFAWMHEHPLAIPQKAIDEGHLWAIDNCSRDAFEVWREQERDKVVTVCRFVVIEVEPAAKTRLQDIMLSDGALKA